MTSERMAEMLEALEEAIFAGALTVSYAGKTVTYRSLDEMTRIAGYLSRRLGRPGATPRVATLTYRHRRYDER